METRERLANGQAFFNGPVDIVYEFCRSCLVLLAKGKNKEHKLLTFSCKQQKSERRMVMDW